MHYKKARKIARDINDVDAELSWIDLKTGVVNFIYGIALIIVIFLVVDKSITLIQGIFYYLVFVYITRAPEIFFAIVLVHHFIPNITLTQVFVVSTIYITIRTILVVLFKFTRIIFYFISSYFMVWLGFYIFAQNVLKWENEYFPFIDNKILSIVLTQIFIGILAIIPVKILLRKFDQNIEDMEEDQEEYEIEEYEKKRKKAEMQQWYQEQHRLRMEKLQADVNNLENLYLSKQNEQKEIEVIDMENYSGDDNEGI